MANVGPLSSNTNDPFKANARVFIGNLPTDKVEKSLLFTVFKKYGEITGVSVHKGFAFVQYTCEADAREAVNGEHGQDICGSYVDCKVASEGRGGAVNNVAHTAPKHRPQQTSALSRFTQHQRSESPPPPSRFQHDNSGSGRSYDSHHSSSSKQHNSSSYHDQTENSRASSGGWIVPGGGGGGGGGGGSSGLSLPRESPLVRYQAEIARERPFDCLVISTDKSLSEYVEYVTGTLKSTAGINCHVITFPGNSSTNSVAGPHLPGSNVTNCETKRLVEDVARLGCCALTVGPVTFTNSVQRSLSVNVHYDHVIEEHRNMPLQDAIHLIVNSYSQYSNQLRTQQISPSALIAYPASALLPLIGNNSSSSLPNIVAGASSSSSQKLTNSSEKDNGQKLGRSSSMNDYSTSRDSRKSSSGRAGRNYRDRSDREDSPDDYDDEYTNDRKGLSSVNGDECMPPTCKRPAKLHEVIKHILLSAEKTGAVPLISNEEIDLAMEILRSARKPSKGSDEELQKVSPSNATTNGSSGQVSATTNGTASSATGAIQVPGHAAQLVNLVAAIPPNAPDLSVSQSNNAAAITTNPPNYVGSAAATVLNAGAALTYVATPATLVTASPAQVTVETSRSEVETSIDTNSRPPATATVMPSAAFIHPQTTATIIGPATPCFIHDQSATATLQYHATQQAAPPNLQQNQPSIPNGANQLQASV